jgi:PAS domain S-box-containing protein
LKAPGAFLQAGRCLILSADAAGAGVRILGAAVAIAGAYFLAARLGLALRSEPSDVAVFWPAAGIAAGIATISGPRTRAALVIGVLAGTIAADLTRDESLLTTLSSGLCDAGEAVLVAWLLERWFGRPFSFSDLRRLAGFLAAAALATAACAMGGAAIMTRVHTAAPYWDVWQAWFLSDWVGIVVVAPLMIELVQMCREPPPQREWIEGLGVLGLVAVACLYTIGRRTGSWLSFTPGAFVLPLLLWLTARCQPAFGMAGAFFASAAIIFATTFGAGRFGDAAVPIAERVKGAQVATTTVTLFTLVLAVLFAQRKQAEDRLAKERAMLARLHEVSSRLWRKRDLRHALDELLAGAIELLGADMGAISILNTTQGVLKIAAHRGFKQEFLDFFREVSAADDSACGRVLRSGERMVIEDVEADTLYTPFRYAARAAGYRAVQSTPIVGREGALLGTLATHFRSVHKPDKQDLRLLDLYVRQAAEIIERHKAEDALRESEERLRLAQLKTGIGVWDCDVRMDKATWTPELEALYGLEPGSVKHYADFRSRVHPDDIEGLEANWEAAVRRRETFKVEFRIIRADGQLRWILATGGAFYDEATGEPVRVLGNNVDITERKLAELALAERNAQLALAGQAALVGSYRYESDLERMTVSEGYAAMHGLPEGTTKTTRSQWLARVHPDDLAQLEALCTQTIAERRSEYNVDYRLVRGGEVRWIEARSIISYNSNGKPQRIVGVNIDVTNRKRTETLLKESKTRLSDALTAGLVVAFEWDARTGRSQRSDNAERIMGFAAGGRFMQQVHPEDRENFRNQMRGLSPDNPSYALTFRFVRPDGRQAWLEETAKGEFDSAGKLLRIKGLTRDITERKELEDHKNTLILELDHRVKNVLATVLTVASRTQETSTSIGEFVAALEGRIKSMATTHELLSYRRWQGIPLAELVHHELAPYATTSNARIDGPDVVLSAEAGQTLAMVFHELASNAAKFGALSVRSGHVSVRWNFRRNGRAESWLRIQWQESGGPHVVPPTRLGFGTSVVRELIPYELGGTVDYVLAPDGAVCKLEIPATWLSSGD